MPLPDRQHLAHGVAYPDSQPPIVYITVCTKDRTPWLAKPQVHDALAEVWKDAINWRVGRYVVMPDHIHFFAAWINSSKDLETWVRYWKSMLTRRLKAGSSVPGKWQSDHWDTRMRTASQYEETWHYVLENPVRAELAATVAEWPFQGQIYELPWD